jgi:predicted RNA methylase
LDEFLKYLELDSGAQKILSAIDHLVTIFRKHRATLRAEAIAVPELESFLYLLALAQENITEGPLHHQGRAIVRKYALGDFDPSGLRNNYVLRFVQELQMSTTSMRKLIAPVTIRHAGGVLFQEAHAEILSEPVQMTLFGLADAGQQKLDLSLGVYYTPAGLARTLTELAIESHLSKDVIRIHDPACGSGIFLCEAIRALQRKQFKGKVELVGLDVSPSAVQMARFSIACALLDWPTHKVKWNLETGSYFETKKPPHPFDVVLMNPPFLSWQALSSELKSVVKETLGETFAGRPDLSTAFIQKALGEIIRGGTLATLIPRGILDSQKGSQWRESLLSDNDVRLIGTFGDHGLFRHAMVSIGAAVIERKSPHNISVGERAAVMVWADERADSAGGALRALRRRLWASNSLEERTESWSIYSVRSNDLLQRKSWLPSPNALGSLVDIIEEKQFPRLSNLFRVRQGIKTGLNDAFLLSNDELLSLPKSEQRFFRPVANGEDIFSGRIQSSTNIFYVPGRFESRRQLLENVPVFGKKLLTFENSLKRRPKSNPQRWWEPVWPRKDLAERSPRIFTKMFGGPDMAAVDARGEFLPLQTFAWMPQWEEMGVDKSLREAALWWYCRLLNSRVFFLLRRELSSASTAGGQLDVSPKYIDQIPLPIPEAEDLIRMASTGMPNLSATEVNDGLVAMAYGTTIDSWPIYAKSN